MSFADYLVLALILLILGGALWYILREKKKGTKCIGCPCSAACSAKGCCNSCDRQKA